jgi:F-type H+-transporting ATPase subunit delta
MDQSAINVRYAKAFFSVAKEKNQLNTLKRDIELVLELCSASADFIHLLESPIVNTSKKSVIIQSIVQDKIDAITLDFLMLILQKKREVYIPGICRNFIDLSRKEQNIKPAQITTATAINEETLTKVKELLAKELNANIELTARINPDILGGLVLRLDDKQYDASVATQLKKVKQSLLKTAL